MRSITKWREWNHEGKNYIFVTCPGCGTEYRLDHDINVQGVINPSLECPGTNCNFHDTAVLVGWPGSGVGKSGKK
jgi:hypothetical protein